MSHQIGSNRNNTDRGRVPISKYLVSRELSFDERIGYLRKLLASKQEQEEAKNLKPNEASKFIELLDEILRARRLEEKHRLACTRYLARVCGWHAILPSSTKISSYRRDTEEPFEGGGSSKVWVGTLNERKVIIKALEFYQSYDDTKKRELIKEFCKEVVVWKNLAHPNIVPFIGAVLVTEPRREKYEIVSEFMANGNIKEFTAKNVDVNRLELLKDIAEGLSYLHSQDIIHGDLKGENVLINRQRRACLADFGLTRIIAQFTSSGSGASKGTYAFMSPELLQPEKCKAKDGRPTKKSDIYSLGILIYFVICGSMPFGDKTPYVAMENLQQGKLPDRPKVGFTDSLWSTVGSCLELEVGKRPTVDTVLERLDEALNA